MRDIFQISARGLRLAGTATLAAGFSALLSSATTPPLPEMKIADVLAEAGRATPFNYQGPSKNLNHLIPPPPPRPARKKTGMSAFPSQAPAAQPHPEKYAEHLRSLKESCPGLATVDDTRFNPALWFTQKILPQTPQPSTLPRQFLEASYFTIGYGKDTAEKADALTALNKLIPDSPEFIDFLERKRTELKAKLAVDPILQKTRHDWPAMKSAKRQDVLNYVSRLTIDTLLPHNQIDYARAIYLTRDYKGSVGYGMYRADFNEIYIDGTEAKIRNSFAFSTEITIHETFHQFTSILSQWRTEGKLTRNLALERQARFYHLFGLPGGSAVHISDNSEGYRTSFGERGAWAFQLAASPFPTTPLRDDLFINRYTASGMPQVISSPLAYSRNSGAGTLPPSCLDR